MKEKKQIQYAGTKPAGNLHFEIKIKIDAKVEERMYEEQETLKAVPASEYGCWEVKYDNESIEAQIKQQIKVQIKNLLKGKVADLHAGGGVLLQFTSNFSARS